MAQTHPQTPRTISQTAASTSASPPSSQMTWEGDKMLNIYIHDYLQKRGFKQTGPIFHTEAGLTPQDDPPIKAPQGLLFEWWVVFWDIFQAKTSKTGKPEALIYNEFANQMRHQAQHSGINRVVPGGGMQARPGMPQGQTVVNGPGSLTIANGMAPGPGQGAQTAFSVPGMAMTNGVIGSQAGMVQQGMSANPAGPSAIGQRPMQARPGNFQSPVLAHPASGMASQQQQPHPQQQMMMRAGAQGMQDYPQAGQPASRAPTPHGGAVASHPSPGQHLTQEQVIREFEGLKQQISMVPEGFWPRVAEEAGIGENSDLNSLPDELKFRVVMAWHRHSQSFRQPGARMANGAPGDATGQQAGQMLPPQIPVGAAAAAAAAKRGMKRGSESPEKDPEALVKEEFLPASKRRRRSTEPVEPNRTPAAVVPVQVPQQPPYPSSAMPYGPGQPGMNGAPRPPNVQPVNGMPMQGHQSMTAVGAPPQGTMGIGPNSMSQPNNPAAMARSQMMDPNLLNQAQQQQQYRMSLAAMHRTVGYPQQPGAQGDPQQDPSMMARQGMAANNVAMQGRVGLKQPAGVMPPHSPANVHAKPNTGNMPPPATPAPSGAKGEDGTDALHAANGADNPSPARSGSTMSGSNVPYNTAPSPSAMQGMSGVVPPGRPGTTIPVVPSNTGASPLAPATTGVAGRVVSAPVVPTQPMPPPSNPAPSAMFHPPDLLDPSMTNGSWGFDEPLDPAFEQIFSSWIDDTHSSNDPSANDMIGTL